MEKKYTRPDKLTTPVSKSRNFSAMLNVEMYRAASSETPSRLAYAGKTRTEQKITPRRQRCEAFH